MNIVNFSGGKDSTAMLIKMVEKKMPIDRVLLCPIQIVLGRFAGCIFVGDNNVGISRPQKERLAKTEGFESSEELFRWFWKKYKTTYFEGTRYVFAKVEVK